MSATRLTLGGFTQPGTARNLIEIPSNADKGFSHMYRFLWIFPPPLFSKLHSLGMIDERFNDKICKYHDVDVYM